MNKVLVVDDDADIARFIEVNLRLEGFEVVVAHDGEAALSAAVREHPDLALLDVMLPKLDGVEVCRRLRADPSTSTLPIIMLTAKSLSADKVVGLTAGADDYIIKPFDTLELIARVHSTLRRNADMRAVSPLTGLPGNNRINDEIVHRSDRGAPFAVCHVDLDNFKAFNDRYGWLRGDEVIGLLAATLRSCVAEAGAPPAFVGHVGGDDFVVICTVDQVEPLTRQVVDRFDAAVRRLHDPADVEAGVMTLTDRQGVQRRFPLVGVSIGVALTGQRTFIDHRQIVAVATEMKVVAKGQPGSAVAIDRRTDLGGGGAVGAAPVEGSVAGGAPGAEVAQ